MDWRGDTLGARGTIRVRPLPLLRAWGAPTAPVSRARYGIFPLVLVAIRFPIRVRVQAEILIFPARISQVTVDEGGYGQGTGSSKTLDNLTTGELGSQATSRLNKQKVEVFAAIAFSEYVDGAWTPPKGSDPDDPVSLGKYSAAGNSRFAIER